MAPSMALRLALLGTVGTALGQNTVTLQGDGGAYVVDLDHGCSVSAAWATGDPSRTNVINTADLGRYVQASYYAGPGGYNGCNWRGQQWPWNPISAGDCAGNPARVISMSHDSSSMRCSIVPMQWACNNVPCECSIDFDYRVEGSILHATVTLNNHRSDQGQYGVMDQEIPAVYVNAFLNKLYGYQGGAPCTGGQLSEIPSGWNDAAADPWIPSTMTTLTEPWLAFVQDNGFGLGVWSRDATKFKAGFFGQKGPGGTKDGSTGYISPLSDVALGWNAVYTYRYALILGNLPDIRGAACRLSSLHGARSMGNTTITI